MPRIAKFRLSSLGLEAVTIAASSMRAPAQVFIMATAVARLFEKACPGLSPNATFSDAIAAAEAGDDNNLWKAFTLLMLKLAELRGVEPCEVGPLPLCAGLPGYTEPQWSELRLRVTNPAPIYVVFGRYASGLETAGDSGAEHFADCYEELGTEMRKPAGWVYSASVKAQRLICRTAFYLQTCPEDFERFVNECVAAGGLERV